jgi:hypothetical protein
LKKKTIPSIKQHEPLPTSRSSQFSRFSRIGLDLLRVRPGGFLLPAGARLYASGGDLFDASTASDVLPPPFPALLFAPIRSSAPSAAVPVPAQLLFRSGGAVLLFHASGGVLPANARKPVLEVQWVLLPPESARSRLCPFLSVTVGSPTPNGVRLPTERSGEPKQIAEPTSRITVPV